jgi:hypothetical protein
MELVPANLTIQPIAVIFLPSLRSFLMKGVNIYTEMVDDIIILQCSVRSVTQSYVV